MVNLQKIDDSSVKFVFTDSDHYLVGNGEIVVPINSLSLVIDESEMVTFKKSATGDPFISFRADNSNLGTKEAIEQFYKENMVGAGGGISEEEVQDMIDSATSGIPSSQVIEQLRTDVNTISANTYTKTQIDGFLSNSEGILTTISGDVQTNAANIRDINETIDEKEEVIASALTEVRQDVADIDAKEEVIASALTEVNQALNNKLDASAYTPTDLSQYWTSAQTQSAIDEAKAYYVDFTAMSVQGITDADWDGLVAAINAHRPILIKASDSNGYVNAITAYIFDNNIIVVGADEGHASQYTFTKNGSNDYSVSTSTKVFVSQTEKDAWNAKQDALTAGSGIDISGNVISAIGGGSITVDDALSTTSENPVANSAITTAINAKQDALYVYTENRDLATAELHSNNSSLIFNAGGASITANNAFGVNTFNVAGSGVTINAENVVTDGMITTAITSSSTDSEIPSAKAVYAALGGLKLVKILQADYDVLATKDNDTLYIIPDGDGGGSDWPE